MTQPKGGDPTTGPGRPTVYSEDVAARILDLISDGKPLRQACRLIEEAPAESTVRQWVVDDREGFAARYARARALGLDALAEETMEISDDGRGDEWVDDDGIVRTNHDVIARSKLRVDTRKWLLSKLKPEVYGDRTKVEHSGGLTLERMSQMSDEELAALAAGNAPK